MALVKIGKAAEIVGCSIQTLRNYTHQGILPEKRNVANQRMYDTKDLEKLITTVKDINKQDDITVYYARSSDNDKNHINNQIKDITDIYGSPDIVIRDNGSGLNENRKGLQRLLKLAENKEITKVYITQQDRLTRFGYSYLEKLLNNYGVEIIVLYDKNLTIEEELMQDFMNLIASFSGKFYQLRSKENKLKLIKKAEEEVKSNGEENS